MSTLITSTWASFVKMGDPTPPGSSMVWEQVGGGKRGAGGGAGEALPDHGRGGGGDGEGRGVGAAGGHMEGGVWGKGWALAMYPMKGKCNLKIKVIFFSLIF